MRELGGSAGQHIADCHINFLQMPDLLCHPEERFAEVKSFQVRGPDGDGELSNPESMHEQVFKQSVKNLLSSSLKDFHNEPQIQGRYALNCRSMASQNTLMSRP